MKNMVQIKKKKKGRPSKADLEARRTPTSIAAAAPESPVKLTASENEKRDERRRSLRRRSFRYNIIDYDEDYLDDDEFFEEKDDLDQDDDDNIEIRRGGKKVKLVVKLNNNDSSSSGEEKGPSRGDSATRPSRRGRVTASRESEVEERDREVKRRRINGEAVKDADLYEQDDDDDVDDDVENGGIHLDKGIDEKRGRKVEDYNAPGTPGEENDDDDDGGGGGPTPLPEIKQLELILDKLQKKDTYGVYSEPVDPEELPDYHEVIENPMDFSTVRKKLADGCYSTLEEFESDIFLISSNAMQYNASDTVYHKQARTIKELAEKKFKRIRIRIRIERSERKSEQKSEPKLEAKSEQKERPYSIIKKQIKKPLWRGMQEPVGSDFSSGATLATEDVHNSCGPDLASNHERPNNHDVPIEGVSSLADPSIEKAEDPQYGKGVLSKFAKRLIMVDENRRATYSLSSLPVDRPESIFTTFESDKKQLIPVGLSGEYAYARSLSRFAANLGPIAWRIASKRIEQLLPPEFKYGRGWIGEFEPLPTTVIFVGQQKDPFRSKSLKHVDSGKHYKNLEGQTAASSHLVNQLTFDGMSAKLPTTNVPSPLHHLPLQHTSEIPPNMITNKVESNSIFPNDKKTSAIFQHQLRVPRNISCSEITGVRQLEPNSQAISDQRKDPIVPQRHLPQGVEVSRRSSEPCTPSVANQKLNTSNISQKQPSQKQPMVSAPLGKHFLQTLPFGKPEGNGHALETLVNGNLGNNFVDSNRTSSSPSTISPQLASFPQRQDQSLSDPVLVMKMMTEKAQRQQNGSNGPVHPQSPSVPSPRGGSGPGGNAAAAAASAWMSVGALGFRPPAQNPSLYNGTRVFYPQAMQSRAESPVSGMMQFHTGKTGLPFQGLVPQPVKSINEAPVQNRPMGFPQLGPNDLSGYQMQTPWRGLSTDNEPKQKQKQDTLPPDLNVAFQSSVDSQQPDLALQL